MSAPSFVTSTTPQACQQPTQLRTCKHSACLHTLYHGLQRTCNEATQCAHPENNLEKLGQVVQVRSGWEGSHYPTTSHSFAFTVTSMHKHVGWVCVTPPISFILTALRTHFSTLHDEDKAAARRHGRRLVVQGESRPDLEQLPTGSHNRKYPVGAAAQRARCVRRAHGLVDDAAQRLVVADRDSDGGVRRAVARRVGTQLEG
mmetsp:Transcript_39107/g.116323  ORF Transcript_39107/g.116323 Transcript_39107/m.116323 type:complete len:202 (-) Transcript_39107:504-1109(-)